MTREDIIKMAIEEAEFVFHGNLFDDESEVFVCTDKDIVRLFHLAAAAEREACEKVAEQELLNTSMLTSMPPKSSAAWNILQGIRARGRG